MLAIQFDEFFTGPQLRRSILKVRGPTVRPVVLVRYSYLLVTQIIEVRWQYEPKIESEKPVCLMAIFSIHLFLSSEAS